LFLGPALVPLGGIVVSLTFTVTLWAAMVARLVIGFPVKDMFPAGIKRLNSLNADDRSIYQLKPAVHCYYNFFI
jgi:hypothetical protein